MAINPSHNATHTGVKADDFIQTRTNALGNRFVYHASRIHQDVIIRQQKWEIGVASGQCKLDLVLTHFLHFSDGGNYWLGRGFCALSSVHAQRFNYIIGAKRFSVVEGNPFTQVKGPDLCICRGFPAYSQFPNQLTSGCNFGQTIKNCAVAHVDHKCV